MTKKKIDYNNLALRYTSPDIDWETRTIWISGDLNEESMRFVRLIQLLDSTYGEIRVQITSSGGLEHVGYAIYDALRVCENTVVTVGTGMVYSAAVLVLLAGDYRFVTANCDLMVHNGILQMDSHNLDSRALANLSKDSVERNARYRATIADRTGLDDKKIFALCEDETFILGGPEIVRLGFAESLVE